MGPNRNGVPDLAPDQPDHLAQSTTGPNWAGWVRAGFALAEVARARPLPQRTQAHR